MNYYEEFGISQDASTAKIRQAYKALARLLHPDAQSEEALKAMAECQMRRLNAMFATLLDHEKRAVYDESLLAGACAACRPLLAAPLKASPAGVWVDMRQAALRQWFWILTGLVMAGLVVWYVAAKDSPVAGVSPAWAPAASSPENPPSAPQAAATVPRRVPRGVAVRHRAVAAAVEAPPAAGDREPAPPGMIAPAPLNAPAARADTAREPEPPRDDPAAPSAGELQTTWAGSWLYLPQPEDAQDAGLYVPSYIELLLVEEHGTLAGNYRARYKVPNKALPSDVWFRAEGNAPVGNSTRLVWVSDQGAKGEAELTLRSSNLLKFTWWTTAFGRRAGLTSGTATLVRQRVR